MVWICRSKEVIFETGGTVGGRRGGGAEEAVEAGNVSCKNARFFFWV